MLEREHGSGSLGLRMEELERPPRPRMQKSQQRITGNDADRPLTVNDDELVLACSGHVFEDRCERSVWPHGLQPR